MSTRSVRITYRARSLGGWVQGGGGGGVLLPREAQKLWGFIKLLEKEDDSLDRARLLILVGIKFPFLRA